MGSSYITVDQLEAVKEYLATFMDFESYESAKEKHKIGNYLSYLLALCKQGLNKIIEVKIVTNLREISVDILKRSNVLVPECILEELMR